jgi:hypothetical protein
MRSNPKTARNLFNDADSDQVSEWELAESLSSSCEVTSSSQTPLLLEVEDSFKNMLKSGKMKNVVMGPDEA